jgi:hypothetical protein
VSIVLWLLIAGFVGYLAISHKDVSMGSPQSAR